MMDAVSIDCFDNHLKNSFYRQICSDRIHRNSTRGRVRVDHVEAKTWLLYVLGEQS